MKGTTKSQKMDEAFSVNKTTADISCCFAAKEIHNPLALFASPLGEGIRSQVRHFALYDPHPPPLPCEGRGDPRAWSLFDLQERQLRIAIARHHLFSAAIQPALTYFAGIGSTRLSCCQ